MIDRFRHVKKMIPVIIFMVLSALSLTGCSSNGPEGRRAFSGEVSFDDTNVDGGSIAFESLQSSGANQFRSGAKISNGTFSVNAKDGLPPGEYLVKIYWPDRSTRESSSTASAVPMSSRRGTSSDSDQAGMADAAASAVFSLPPAAERIPAKYNTRSELRMTIQEKGKNHFVFDLQSSSN